MDVAPVGRSRPAGGDLPDHRPHDRASSGAGGAADEDVESLVLDSEAEVDGADGAFLANDLFEGIKLAGGRKRKGGGIERPAKLGNGDFELGEIHGTSWKGCFERS